MEHKKSLAFVSSRVHSQQPRMQAYLALSLVLFAYDPPVYSYDFLCSM